MRWNDEEVFGDPDPVSHGPHNCEVCRELRESLEQEAEELLLSRNYPLAKAVLVYGMLTVASLESVIQQNPLSRSRLKPIIDALRIEMGQAAGALAQHKHREIDGDTKDS